MKKGNLFIYLKIIVIFIAGFLLVYNRINKDANIIGFGLLFFYLYLIYLFKPIEFLNNLPYFFIILPMLMGGFLIEEGTYLFEVEKTTYKNGTFLNNLFFSIIFMEFLIYPIKTNKTKNTFKINKYFIEMIIFLSVFILYAFFLKTGIPLFKGIHRTVYFDSIVPYYINLIKGRLSFICLVLGYYYIQSKNKKYIIYFSLIVLYHILCSIKGGELLVIIYTFLLPIFLYYSVKIFGEEKNKLNKKVRYGLLFLLISVFLLVFINYKTVENYNHKTTAIEKIKKRIESAGQIWWTINDIKQVKNEIRIKKFIKNFDLEEPNVNKGMNQLMDEVVPREILSIWRKPGARGRSLANGFPAIGFYYFGYIGVMILLIIIGKIVIFTKKEVLEIFESGDVLSFLFIAPIIEIVIRVVAQGDIQLFFEKRFYIIVIAYLLYELLKYIIIKVKKNE